MSRHLDSADGLCAEPDAATRDYVFNHTMLRIKEPTRSLDFYTRVLGMRLLRRLDFDEMNFTLFFLGFVDDAAAAEAPADRHARTTWTFSQRAVLELTWNWGSENDPNVAFHSGNEEPKGFGHIAVTVPDIHAAAARFDELGVEFIKRPEGGRMPGIAFIRDPDGYWIEVLQADAVERIARGD